MAFPSPVTLALVGVQVQVTLERASLLAKIILHFSAYL